MSAPHHGEVCARQPGQPRPARYNCIIHSVKVALKSRQMQTHWQLESGSINESLKAWLGLPQGNEKYFFY